MFQFISAINFAFVVVVVEMNKQYLMDFLLLKYNNYEMESNFS